MFQQLQHHETNKMQMWFFSLSDPADELVAISDDGPPLLVPAPDVIDTSAVHSAQTAQ